MPPKGRPKAGLNREKVLDAALDLVDAHGLPALSMRRLGTELGVEAMTLYYHVPNKAALLDGMVDVVIDRALAGIPDIEGAEWRAWMRQFAVSVRAELMRHPGVLALVATHPLSSPAALRRLEAWLAALRSAGMGLAWAMDLFNAIGTFVVGHTLAEVGETPGHEGSEPVLGADQLDRAAFPHLYEVVSTGAGLDFASRFHRTLDMLLDGYAAAVPSYDS